VTRLPGSLVGHAFAIRVQFGHVNRGVRYEAVVRLTDNPDQPYFMLSWRRM
jgi:hypothetical protein